MKWWYIPILQLGRLCCRLHLSLPWLASPLRLQYCDVLSLCFLRYILEYALFLRCGKQAGRAEPDLPDYSGDLAEDIIRDLGAMISGAGKDAIRKTLRKGIPKVKKRIEDRYGTKRHPHLALTESLKSIVQPGYHISTPQLTFKDFEWILESWNAYTDANDLPKTKKPEIPNRKGTLPKDNKERQAAIEIRGFDFRAAKKAYILQLRHDIITTHGSWVRGRYNLFGEARESGRSYASSHTSHENLESDDESLNTDLVYGQDENGDCETKAATLKRRAPTDQSDIANKRRRPQWLEDEGVVDTLTIAAKYETRKDTTNQHSSYSNSN
jgi:hypothetical protein